MPSPTHSTETRKDARQLRVELGATQARQAELLRAIDKHRDTLDSAAGGGAQPFHRDDVDNALYNLAETIRRESPLPVTQPETREPRYTLEDTLEGLRVLIKELLTGLHNGTAPDREARWQDGWRAGVSDAKDAVLAALTQPQHPDSETNGMLAAAAAFEAQAAWIGDDKEADNGRAFDRHHTYLTCAKWLRDRAKDLGVQEGERCGGSRERKVWSWGMFDLIPCGGCPDCETREAVPEEAVEAARLELIGLGWLDANARAWLAVAGKAPGDKPTPEEWEAAQGEIRDQLSRAIATALPALEAAWRKRLEEEQDILRTKLGRIRAAVEGDADMEKLPALRGFLIHESAAGKEVNLD
jgi:hypothetical protein